MMQHSVQNPPPTNQQKTASKHPAPYSIRFTREERLRLDRDAGSLALSAYIRRMLFEGETRNKPPVRKRRSASVDQTALAQALAKLGASHLASNLNQIAKAANMGALPVDAELVRELHQACADVRAMRVRLTEALGVSAKDAGP